MNYFFKKNLNFFLIFLFFSACQIKQKNEIPYLKDDKMIDVLIDIQLAEATVSNSVNQVKDSLLPIYYSYIFKKYDISDTVYRYNLTKLTSNPKRMNYIFEKVTEKLNKKEAESRTNN